MDNHKKTTSDYWDERARKEFSYKKEKFYTITPIPYYYRRRKVVLKKLEELIDKSGSRQICDFGCGDGEYISHLYKNGYMFYGVDASDKMIEAARERTNVCKGGVEFEVSSDGIGIERSFDLVYSSAIWAHINEEEVRRLYANIFQHIKEKGIFIICEQTAPYYYEGNNYIRRTTMQYVDLIREAGFEVIEGKIIDFWLHRILFEKKLVKKICRRKKYSGKEQDELKIQLNKSIIYRFVSLILTKLSVPHIYKCLKKGKVINRWGYCFIVAIKPEKGK